jgi:hypothetical protein
VENGTSTRHEARSAASGGTIGRARPAVTGRSLRPLPISISRSRTSRPHRPPRNLLRTPRILCPTAVARSAPPPPSSAARQRPSRTSKSESRNLPSPRVGERDRVKGNEGRHTPETEINDPRRSRTFRSSTCASLERAG